MKPPFLLLIFAASFAALLALPFSPELAVSPVALSGLVLIMRGDYGRRFRPLLRPVAVVKPTRECLRLAA